MNAICALSRCMEPQIAVEAYILDYHRLIANAKSHTRANVVYYCGAIQYSYFTFVQILSIRYRVSNQALPDLPTFLYPLFTSGIPIFSPLLFFFSPLPFSPLVFRYLKTSLLVWFGQTNPALNQCIYIYINKFRFS